MKKFNLIVVGVVILGLTIITILLIQSDPSHAANQFINDKSAFSDEDNGNYMICFTPEAAKLLRQRQEQGLNMLYNDDATVFKYEVYDLFSLRYLEDYPGTIVDLPFATSSINNFKQIYKGEELIKTFDFQNQINVSPFASSSLQEVQMPQFYMLLKFEEGTDIQSYLNIDDCPAVFELEYQPRFPEEYNRSNFRFKLSNIFSTKDSIQFFNWTNTSLTGYNLNVKRDNIFSKWEPEGTDDIFRILITRFSLDTDKFYPIFTREEILNELESYANQGYKIEEIDMIVSQKLEESEKWKNTTVEERREAQCNSLFRATIEEYIDCSQYE